ncbi:MAG: hypothetical protein V3R70_11200 [Syntrophobacteria bacterium]
MTSQAPEADPVQPMGENGRGNHLPCRSREFLRDLGFRPLEKDISIFSGG